MDLIFVFFFLQELKKTGIKRRGVHTCRLSRKRRCIKKSLKKCRASHPNLRLVFVENFCFFRNRINRVLSCCFCCFFLENSFSQHLIGWFGPKLCFEFFNCLFGFLLKKFLIGSSAFY